MLRVRDIMTDDIVSVSPSASISEVAQRMRGCRAGMAAVCENGRFRGVITEKDIVTSVGASNSNPKREPVRSLVNKRYPLISPGVEILQAAKVMINNGVRTLPVVQNGRLLGLVTLEELARASSAVSAMVFAKTSWASLPVRVKTH